MNFFQKYTQHNIARGLLLLFVLSAVVLPALAPISTHAQNPDPLPTQGLAEATNTGLDNASFAPKSGCMQGGLTSASIGGCVALGSYYVMAFFYRIAGWTAIFFNFSLNELVIGMGELVRSMDGIMVAWKTIRDITNVFLVFLTVYIGIATILGISGFGAKQMLWKVVLAALLVNFSVTFTKVIIDISNLTAVQTVLMFQSQVPGNTVTAACAERARAAVGAVGDNEVCITNGISSAFWSQMKITTIFDFDGMKDGDPNNGTDASLYWTMALTYFMATLMFIVLAFVFGAAGFLFVARFIILVFLLIVSPLALVLWITGVTGQGRAWWHALINQSIFPPAILLCWWIAYIILKEYTATYEGVTLGAGGAVSPSAISIVTMFIIVIGFLIMGLVIAKQLGAHGANAVLKTGENWSKKSAGFMAASTVGWGSYHAARKYREKAAEAHAKGADGEYVNNTASARLFRTGLGKKMDRGAEGLIAAPSKMSFAKGAKSYTDRRDSVEKAEKEQKTTYTKINRKQSLTNAIKGRTVADDVSNSVAGSFSSARNVVPQDTATVLKSATVEDLKDNADLLRKNPDSLAHVSHANYKKLRENKEGTFTEDELKTFDKSREKHFMELKGEDLQNTVQKASPSELAELDKDFLGRAEVLHNLDTQTLTGMVRTGLSQEKREAMKAAVEAEYANIPKSQEQDAEPSLILDPKTGKPAKKAPSNVALTPKQQNIVKLHNWFNDSDKMKV